LNSAGEPGVEQAASGSVRLRKRKGQSQQYMREYMREYRRDPEYRAHERAAALERLKRPDVQKRVKQYNLLNKVHAVLMVAGEIACRICRTDDLRVLTINHINGTGAVERKAAKTRTSLYFNIRTGKRGTEGLEVTCYNCNILYEYERGARAWPADAAQIIADAKAEVGL
jgi:hypothetical protein